MSEFQLTHIALVGARMTAFHAYGFYTRNELSLRRFEGELRDSRDDEVISAVLSNGFRNQTFDPLNLPNNMPMRQRCAVVHKSKKHWS